MAGTQTGGSSGLGGNTVSGGTAGTGGIAGAGAGQGGSGPGGSSAGNRCVGPAPGHGVHKIDLLFAIDNSPSMTDKQTFLQQAVPALLSRLSVPNCVDEFGTPVPRQGTACPSGSQVEFTPITDIHMGIVTSSLGCGGKPCTTLTTNPLDDDHGHLAGTLARGQAVSGYNGLGFLAWDPQQNGAQPGGGTVYADLDQLTTDFAAMIGTVGEQGAPYESGLESWYRFLVDPEPPAEVVVQNNLTVAQGIDSELLRQRAAFLRPDSLVAIVMLADENDCSMIDYGQAWLVANTGRLPGGTSVCQTNPNDACCLSCATANAPANCQPPAQDPACQRNTGEGNPPGYLSVAEDNPNLRCWNMRRRFGFDLLFPVSRYVNGLTQPTLRARDGTTTLMNPLMAPSDTYPGLPCRVDSSLVYLAGIVGVPWQDIATDETRDTPDQLAFMTYSELTTAGRWDLIVGDSLPGSGQPPRPPTDPFMVESVQPRTSGLPASVATNNPITGQAIVDPTSTNPKATINGHEVSTSAPNPQDDLQYACIFELPQNMQRDCTSSEYTTTDPSLRKGCDCRSGTEGRNRPLCQPPEGGPAGTQQYFAKAYPGLRYLEVLKDYGEQSTSLGSIVASACPKVTSGDTNAAASGYNPAVNAIINRLKEKF